MANFLDKLIAPVRRMIESHNTYDEMLEAGLPLTSDTAEGNIDDLTNYLKTLPLQGLISKILKMPKKLGEQYIRHGGPSYSQVGDKFSDVIPPPKLISPKTSKGSLPLPGKVTSSTKFSDEQILERIKNLKPLEVEKNLKNLKSFNRGQTTGYTDKRGLSKTSKELELFTKMGLRNIEQTIKNLKPPVHVPRTYSSDFHHGPRVREEITTYSNPFKELLPWLLISSMQEDKK